MKKWHMKVKISHTRICNPNPCNYDRYAKHKLSATGQDTLNFHKVIEILPVQGQDLHNESGHGLSTSFSCTVSGIHISLQKLSFSEEFRLEWMRSGRFREYFHHLAFSCFLVFLFCCWFVSTSSCLLVAYLLPDHQSGIFHSHYISIVREAEWFPVWVKCYSHLEPILRCQAKAFWIKGTDEEYQTVVIFKGYSMLQINKYD